jgi:hypothetical protein
MKNLSFFLSVFAFTIILTNKLQAQSPLQVSAGQDLSVCYGAYTELNAYAAGGFPPYTYKWIPNEELAASTTASVISTPTFNTTYKVIVTDAKGNTARDEVYVEVGQRPSIKTSGYVSVEPNEKTKLDVRATGNGALTYSWKPTMGLDNPTSSNPIAKPNMTTTYTVMVRDSKGCMATEQFTVNVNVGASAALREK